MLIIGLTGGIGSGKSAVSDLFKKLGAEIIDTDQIARDLVAPGTPALKKIHDYFGENFINPDQSLNRQHLREHIFKVPSDKAWLEALLHPLIQQEAFKRCQALNQCYAVVVIPLLTENNRQQYAFLDRICVVDCEEALQLQRTLTRDGISLEFATRILKTQPSREARLALADDIIVNNDSLSLLEKQVMALDEQYKALCKRKS